MMRSELRWYEYAIALLPFALGVASLGALGFAVGGAGAAVNLGILSASLPRRTRLVANAIVNLIAVALWASLVVLMH